MKLRLMEIPGPRLKAVDGELPPGEVEVPAGWTILETVSVTSSAGWQVYAVLTELELPPTVAELLEAAIAAGPDNAVGIPGVVLRQALREMGYDVPEPSPIQVPDDSTVRKISDRAITDRPGPGGP